ncbi:MAG TPA: hypothetical protein VH000_09455 [Rhizomicrobium sp.]|jgi:exo-beta-1,3-glucanase (GH17 family)|nr:hypothetical protein [Rhizomicrobium sp.]
MDCPNSTRRAVLAGLGALTAAPAMASVCAKSRANLAPLQDAMANGRFIAYQPTALKAIDGQLTHASDNSIRADLNVLRPWFDSLITYGVTAGGERIPDIAASLKFRSVILGVWDPSNETEISNAVAAWKRNPQLVNGISLGNEIVFGKRGTWADLAKYLAQVRARAPGAALTVSETFAEYLDHPESKLALAQMDFMLANVHPAFEPWFKTAPPYNWADFVVKVTARLSSAFCGPVLVKETGVPSGPASASFTENAQAAFWRALEKQFPRSPERAFAYFTAFDAPWRTNDFNPVAGPHPEEAHWGLFTEDRRPKLVIAALPKLKNY